MAGVEGQKGGWLGDERREKQESDHVGLRLLCGEWFERLKGESRETSGVTLTISLTRGLAVKMKRHQQIRKYCSLYSAVSF